MGANGFKYNCTPTGMEFHKSRKKVRMITGPYGSGKSCMIVNELLMNAIEQPICPGSECPKAPRGLRKTKIGVVRSSFPELKNATRLSIMEVFPDQCGTILSGGSPITGNYFIPLNDGTAAQVEFFLTSLQSAEDTEKIRSINWTMAWINEATGVSYQVFEDLLGRVGRYPSKEEGGCGWPGIIMDFNWPPNGHWLHTLMKHAKAGSDTYDLFTQPPAAFKEVDDYGNVSYSLNKNAENLDNLDTNYYNDQIDARLIEGRYDQIDTLFCLLDVPMKDGKPVFPDFRYDDHVDRAVIEPQKNCSTIIGIDTSGIHPACVIAQEFHGHWAILDELYGDELGLETFMYKGLMPLLRKKYHNCDFIASCDPANARDALTATSPTDYLKRFNIDIFLPATNDPKTRIRVAEVLFNRAKGHGGWLISPNCVQLITALQGEYKYKKLKISGSVEPVYDAKPDKNSSYSHIADAFQYLAMYINQGISQKTFNTENIKRIVSQRRKILSRVV